MRTIEQMIQSEVLVCLSSLVSTLANGSHDSQSIALDARSPRVARDGAAALGELLDQAFELASSVPDYEEAATQEGWVFVPFKGGWGYYVKDNIAGATTPYDEFEPSATLEEAAQECCEFQGIEPYDREVLEHWAVTDWFADKLLAAGEKVDKDFAGMCVWARTTSGQGIASDGVIERIYAELAK